MWKQLPTRKLATGNTAGRKKEKIRVTLSLTCNASGTDKGGLFLIGTAKKLPTRIRPRDCDEYAVSQQQERLDDI